ncbi:MAG: DUF4268 domain-containing protein [Bacteroidetes bacterium]|nr:DUF4268 domain-containing protein [Bacteroidota bacterium]
MYTRQEASAIRTAFWTRFGQYMKPVPSAAGHTVNWLNYKTGIRHIYFRMEADTKKMSIALELRHPDAELRQLYYEQLLSLKKIFASYMEEEWEWQPHFVNEEGLTISRVICSREGVNLFQEADWPTIISFLKPRLIALDAFWDMVKEQFM